MKNTYNPFKPNLQYIKRKWLTKICPEDKGGSFNMNLYNDYLEAISTAQIFKHEPKKA